MKLDVHEFVPRHSLNTVVTPFFDLNCDGVDVDDTKRKLNDDAARVMLSAIRLVMTEDGGTHFETSKFEFIILLVIKQI